MNPEELEPKEGVSRRKMLKRIGAGAAIAWTAPILTSIRTPAFATTGETCGCDLSTPCNAPIDCHNSGGQCNCWVNSAHSACFCGPFDPCSNHTPCGPGDTCAPGETCVENCCGKLCYTPCSVGGRSRPKSGTARRYGVSRF
jgi:hypothetical protein